MKPLILALDVTGHPSEWITWQEAITYQATDRVAREMGEHEFTFRGGISRSTGEVSVITTSSIIALKGRDPLGWKPITPHLDNELLFFRDRYICAYCGRQGDSHGHAKLTRDHIIPLSQGGPDRWMNVVTSCKLCNGKKGGRTPEQAHMELLYVPYVPSKYEQLILSNRRILADQMELLMNHLPSNSRLLVA